MKNFTVKCENSSGRPAAKMYYSNDTTFITVYTKIDGKSKKILSLIVTPDDRGIHYIITDKNKNCLSDTI
jgi:hypothetical protein